MNLQLAVSKSTMFPLPKNIDGLWLSLDLPSTWTFVRIENEKIQIGVTGMLVNGQVQRHGSVLVIQLNSSKPLVAYASLKDEVLEFEFVTHRMSFKRAEEIELQKT